MKAKKIVKTLKDLLIFKLVNHPGEISLEQRQEMRIAINEAEAALMERKAKFGEQ